MTPATRVFILMLFVLSGVSLSLAQGPSDARDSERSATAAQSVGVQLPASLKAAGVAATDEGIINWLASGPASTARNAALPSDDRTQLAIDAITALGVAKSRRAQPVLASIAAGQLPDGTTQLLEYDLSRTSPETRNDFQMKAVRLLRYNACIALGLIGMPESRDAIRRAFSDEVQVPAKIQMALALAGTGDGDGIGFLVEVINQGNRREGAAAARAIYLATGQDFGYTENTPVRLRKEKAAQYAQWWRAAKGRITPDPKAMAERRLALAQPKTYTPRSTRDLLRVASQLFDFANREVAREAHERLNRSGVALNPELERIALNAGEDLDIRMAAMNYYYVANGPQSEAMMRKLRRDENPEIVDKANSVLEQIESGVRPLDATLRR